MNSEPIIEETSQLPTRDELIRFLGRQKHRIAAVYDEDGTQVHLGGRWSGDPRFGENRVLGPIRCAVCDAPAGEVTLMKVVAESELAIRIAEALGKPIEGYICFGGDHAAQRNKAMLRPFVRATNALATTRLTKSGHAMQWLADDEGKIKLTYARTSRSYRSSKAHKAVQKASRRTNRV